MNTAGIHKEIQRRTEDLQGLLDALIAVPSPPGAESRALGFLKRLLEYMGLATSWIYLRESQLQEHPAFVPSGARHGRNLLAVWGAPRAAPGRYRILFNGHVDVVPPGELGGWASPPYQATVRDNRIYGNGAADMKGGIACLLYVLSVLIEQGLYPTKPVAVELVVDEERLGNGTLACVLAGVSAEQAMFLEPSGAHRIVTGHRGAIRFEVTIKGQGSELSSRGESTATVSQLTEVFNAIQQWRTERRAEAARVLGESRADRAPVYFGKICGGHWFSSPLVDIHINGVLGVIPGESLASVKDAFCQHFSSWPALAPLIQSKQVIINLDGGFVEPSFTPLDSRFVTGFKSAVADVLGAEPTIEHCENSGCDIRLRRLYDRDCECVWYGPAGSRCHQSNESVSLEELVGVSRVLAEWLIRECIC